MLREIKKKGIFNILVDTEARNMNYLFRYAEHPPMEPSMETIILETLLSGSKWTNFLLARTKVIKTSGNCKSILKSK